MRSERKQPKQHDRPRQVHSLSNGDIAELLAKKAEDARPPLSKAFRRASRRALLWPEEAADIVRAQRSLTELPGVGPYLEKVIQGWIAKPPEVPQPPEIRSNFLTLAQARSVLATQPEWRSHLKGDLQMHTDWSDGSGTIQEMAEAACQRGYEYIAITDHSKGLKIAGGIDEDKVKRQALEIKNVNGTLRGTGCRLRVLRSLEVNLSVAGGVDMEEQALRDLDVVLGCFHSSLRRKKDQTERYLAALRNPAIQILGHPRGRIYNYRVGLSADWLRIFDLAAELDKAVEIDRYPDRQDLSGDLITLAKKTGCRISLGTDSHGPSQLDFIEFGLASAAIAELDSNRIINFMPLDALHEWIGSVRGVPSN